MKNKIDPVSLSIAEYYFKSREIEKWPKKLILFDNNTDIFSNFLITLERIITKIFKFIGFTECVLKQFFCRQTANSKEKIDMAPIHLINEGPTAGGKTTALRILSMLMLSFQILTSNKISDAGLTSVGLNISGKNIIFDEAPILNKNKQGFDCYGLTDLWKSILTDFETSTQFGDMNKEGRHATEHRISIFASVTICWDRVSKWIQQSAFNRFARVSFHKNDATGEITTLLEKIYATIDTENRAEKESQSLITRKMCVISHLIYRLIDFGGLPKPFTMIPRNLLSRFILYIFKHGYLIDESSLRKAQVYLSTSIVLCFNRIGLINNFSDYFNQDENKNIDNNNLLAKIHNYIPMLCVSEDDSLRAFATCFPDFVDERELCLLKILKELTHTLERDSIKTRYLCLTVKGQVMLDQRFVFHCVEGGTSQLFHNIASYSNGKMQYEEVRALLLSLSQKYVASTNNIKNIGNMEGDGNTEDKNKTDNNDNKDNKNKQKKNLNKESSSKKSRVSGKFSINSDDNKYISEDMENITGDDDENVETYQEDNEPLENHFVKVSNNDEEVNRIINNEEKSRITHEKKNKTKNSKNKDIQNDSSAKIKILSSNQSDSENDADAIIKQTASTSNLNLNLNSNIKQKKPLKSKKKTYPSNLKKTNNLDASNQEINNEAKKDAGKPKKKRENIITEVTRQIFSNMKNKNANNNNNKNKRKRENNEDQDTNNNNEYQDIDNSKDNIDPRQMIHLIFEAEQEKRFENSRAKSEIPCIQIHEGNVYNGKKVTTLIIATKLLRFQSDPLKNISEKIMSYNHALERKVVLPIPEISKDSNFLNTCFIEPDPKIKLAFKKTNESKLDSKLDEIIHTIDKLDDQNQPISVIDKDQLEKYKKEKKKFLDFLELDDKEELKRNLDIAALEYHMYMQGVPKSDWSKYYPATIQEYFKKTNPHADLDYPHIDQPKPAPTQNSK
jgi:hypothetical protein